MYYEIHQNLIPVAFESMLLEPSIGSRFNYFTYRMLRSDTISHRNSFLPRTILDWSSLPQSPVGQPSLNSFKMALIKTYFF